MPAKKQTLSAEQQLDLEELRQELEAATREPLQLTKVRCNKCVYFKAAATFGLPCEQLGVTPKDEPCQRFLIDSRQLKLEEKRTRTFLKNLSELNSDQRYILAALIITSDRLIKIGFTPGETVFFRVAGSLDCVSNYVRGFVIGCSRNGKSINIYGRNHFTALLKIGSVLRQAEWLEKKAKLIAENRIADPQVKLTKRSGRLYFTDISYVPPLITTKKKNKLQAKPLAKPLSKPTILKKTDLRLR